MPVLCRCGVQENSRAYRLHVQADEISTRICSVKDVLTRWSRCGCCRFLLSLAVYRCAHTIFGSVQSQKCSYGWVAVVVSMHACSLRNVACADLNDRRRACCCHHCWEFGRSDNIVPLLPSCCGTYAAPDTVWCANNVTGRFWTCSRSWTTTRRPL